MINVKSFQIVTTGTTTVIPEILTQPLSLTKSVGDSVSLSIVADGGAGTALTYQWRKNGENILNATNSTHAIGSATLGDAGDYTVAVTSPAGTTVSAVATLTVTIGAVAPSFAVDPTGATVLVGGAHTFSTVVNGTAPLTYQWERSSNGGANYTPVNSATSTSLVITNAQLSDAGLYRLVATNSQGSVTSASATLVVNQAPVITVQPIGGTLQPGGSLTLSVTATGNPAPTYQWRKNGVALNGATAANYAITNATGADTGAYTVVVTNSVGSATSAAASVAVLSSTLAATATTPTATGRNPDTRLTITFNEVPTVGVAGVLHIRDAADNSIVETIDLAAATALRDTLRAGSTLSTQLLPVLKKPIGGIATDFNYYPITVSGQTATIYPRNGVLAYGRTYYVTVEPGVFTNSTGLAFAGISNTTTWRFSTKNSGPANGSTTLIVAADGSGDFDTVQAAFDFVPAANTTPTLIRVKRGTYFEIVAFQSKHNLTLLGEDVDETIITYPNNNTFNNVSGVYHRATFLAQSVRDCTIANLTINNTTPQNGSQAEALIVNGASATTGRNLVTRCKFFSYQDTVQFNKQTYVSDCTIVGDVDFLWGDGPVFLINCDIRLLRTGGYLTQIRNSSGNHGYVFVNSRFTAPPGVTGNFLGRIDPASFPFSEVVVLDSTFGDASNNAFLATGNGASGANYLAGWWLLNNATTPTSAANVRNWTNNLRDANGLLLANPNTDAFTTMPTDETTQANYRNPTWVLNTSIAGAVNGSWTPALAPLIAAGPASQQVALNAPATLTVAAVGVPSVTYQWRKNGTEISNATSASYTIASATADDAANYSVTVSNSAGVITTLPATLTVDNTVVAPAISTPPASQFLAEGESLSLSVTASGTAPFTYLWRKNGNPISNAISRTFTINSTVIADSGDYTVVVTNASGSATSDAAVVTVKGVGLIRASGYAGTVTGGAAGATVTVSTAAALISFAESTTPYTIIVAGTIDLGASGRVKPRSNKTIRGATITSTILGTIEISNANNVIISNLNISADTGVPGENDGVTIANSTNVLVTKCSIYNCSDGNLDLVAGSDLVTISWCKFYYTRNNGHNFANLVGSNDDDKGDGDGLTNYRITWHHNWWTGQAKQRMIACRFGRSHMYNNLWDAAGNDYCTETRRLAQIFSERNYYQNVKNPLAKRTALQTDAGLLMTLGNVFDNCTGTQLVAADTMFTPPYSYQLTAAANVPALVRAGAGNVTTDTPSADSATISGPSGGANAGQNVTLTALPNGFIPASYQWRFQNRVIAGATSITLPLTNVQSTNAGDYAVELVSANGNTVVSLNYTLAVGAALTPSESWRSTHFGLTTNTGNAADTADPDADGLTNLVEYALGLDPLTATNAGLPQLAANESEWTYTYTRPADRTDLTYAVEFSTDLANWTANGVTHERTATGTTETWRGRVPLSTGPRVFFRLKLERP
ncbi:MAG: pectinesterase family protein [Candidatus Didemnitutus sp.]|nr:pectinesterase family protein [Candidatus Didemnitutus sp.]